MNIHLEQEYQTNKKGKERGKNKKISTIQRKQKIK